jgi:endonuclease/exonuclease/phosphatase family metal-dependent hydrolase
MCGPAKKQGLKNLTLTPNANGKAACYVPAMSTLRVATFNIESFDERPERGRPLAERIAVLRPLLVSLRADILCLQEVNAQRVAANAQRGFHALNALLDGTPYRDFHRVSSAAAVPSDLHNLVVLSRFPLTDATRHLHDAVASPVWPASRAATPGDAAIHWDRPLLSVTVQAGQARRLHLLNLHLRAPIAAPVAGRKLKPFVWGETAAWAEGYYIAAMKRTGQALEARLLVDRLFDADPEALVLVAGDLNAESGESPVRLLSADVEDTGNPALAGRQLHALEAMVPVEERFTVLHRGRRLMLDHLLASPALRQRLLQVEIPNRDLADEYFSWLAELRERGSFHAPVIAEFDWR